MSPLTTGRLSVFLFHKIPRQSSPLVPEDMDLVRFEHVLDEVLSAFHVLPLDEAVRCLESGKLPARSACITFDDGYPDWLAGAVPALRKRNLHATFFITSGQFSGRPLWNERVLTAVGHQTGPVIQLSHHALANVPVATLMQRQAAIRQLDQELKYLTLYRREQLLTELDEQCVTTTSSVPVMTIEALRELHSQGFGIGAHTIDHPILTYCSAQEVEREVGGVREELESIVGGRIYGFAYPNGRPYADFSSHHVRAVRRVGYRYAVTTHWGAATAGSSPFQIPRFTPWAPNTLRALYQMASNLIAAPMELDEIP
ncbi:polysaccharide deacetylase family protein [Rhodoferax sp. 4810]|nr:polysaccharide deacetylase family protein [Rhodoferax jenense]